MKFGELTVVAVFQIRVTVPVQNGIVMSRSVWNSRSRCWYRTVLTPRISCEIKCNDTVGWTARILASNVQFRAWKRHDIFRDDASVKLKGKIIKDRHKKKWIR